MRVTAKTILKIAEYEIGNHDNGNNLCKYNTAYYGKAVQGSRYPWCCVFVWWVFHTAGADELFFFGKKTASCTTLRDAMILQRVEKPKPGDLVFFNFNKDSKSEHVGIVESVNENGSVNTIEGNTWIGNDANGGKVMGRVRDKSVIHYYIRPNYLEEEPEPEVGEDYYIVQKGDTLSKIAKKYGTTYQHLQEINGIKNPNLIYVKQKIKIR